MSGARSFSRVQSGVWQLSYANRNAVGRDGGTLLDRGFATLPNLGDQLRLSSGSEPLDPKKNHGWPVRRGLRQVGVKIMVERYAGHPVRSRVTQDFGVFCRVKPDFRHVDSIPALLPQDLGR